MQWGAHLPSLYPLPRHPPKSRVAISPCAGRIGVPRDRLLPRVCTEPGEGRGCVSAAVASARRIRFSKLAFVAGRPAALTDDRTAHCET